MPKRTFGHAATTLASRTWPALTPARACRNGGTVLAVRRTNFGMRVSGLNRATEQQEEGLKLHSRRMRWTALQVPCTCTILQHMREMTAMRRPLHEIAHCCRYAHVRRRQDTAEVLIFNHRSAAACAGEPSLLLTQVARSQAPAQCCTHGTPQYS